MSTALLFTQLPTSGAEQSTAIAVVGGDFGPVATGGVRVSSAAHRPASGWSLCSQPQTRSQRHGLCVVARGKRKYAAGTFGISQCVDACNHRGT